MEDAWAAELVADGTIALPLALRRCRSWTPGTVLILVDTPDGVLLVDRATALTRLRTKLRGHSLAEELISDRQAAAAADRDEQ